MNKILIHNRQYIIALSLIIVIISIYTISVYARAGGGGGGGGFGGGGDVDIGILIYIFFKIPFPWNFILIGLIIFVVWRSKKKNKQQSILNRLPSIDSSDNTKAIKHYLKENHNFDINAFKAKVKQAFMQIQEAWMHKDMGKVRKYISDGVYQRFNIQFKMMNILDQKNIIENLSVKNIFIDKIEYDGNYDIIHVAINATITDEFVSSKYPQFNSGGTEEFVEYWSFIKKHGVKEVNLYNSQNCPKCGAELPLNAGDVSCCSYCKTITNLGDYDWVLSEITQADDYISSHPKVSKQSSLAAKISELIKTNEDFSIQNIEDKASNGYLQILTALALKESALMRRFVQDELFEKLKHINNDNIIYNRIFLNDVTLLGASRNNNKNILFIAVKSSFQRVKLVNGQVVLIDPYIISKTEIVVMNRDIDYGFSKGSLYAHVCPSCGGTVKDTIDIKCQYCGDELNRTKNEWIISDILSVSEYKTYFNENKDYFVTGINIDKLDEIYDVRDYAFNNVLVVMAADGKFQQNELFMAQKLAKKWGYKTERIKPMFELAKNNALVIKMPENQKKRQKIYKLMEKAASIDGMVSAEEKLLLDNVMKQYNI